MHRIPTTNATHPNNIIIVHKQVYETSHVFVICNPDFKIISLNDWHDQFLIYHLKTINTLLHYDVTWPACDPLCTIYNSVKSHASTYSLQIESESFGVSISTYVSSYTVNVKFSSAQYFFASIYTSSFCSVAIVLISTLISCCFTISGMQL